MDPQNNIPPTQLPAVDSNQYVDPIQSAQLPQQPTSQSGQFPTITAPSQLMAASTANTLSAEDVDLIEKAWVEKARAIVNSTHGDPFMQSKELSKMKAEYIKKRFNIDVKVSE